MSTQKRKPVMTKDEVITTTFSIQEMFEYFDKKNSQAVADNTNLSKALLELIKVQSTTTIVEQNQAPVTHDPNHNIVSGITALLADAIATHAEY